MQQNVVENGLQRLGRWQRSRVVKTYLTLLLVVAGPVLTLSTALLLGAFNGPANPQLLRIILLADVVYTLILATFVARRIVRIIAARRSRSAGSKLHMRLSTVFSVIALIPTVLVAIFATLTLNFGLEGWFSTRVQQVVGNSLESAQAYEQEHRATLTSDAAFLANFIERQRPMYNFVGAGEMRDALSRGQDTMQKTLAEAFVIDGASKIVARGTRSYLFDYEAPNQNEILRVRSGETVLIEDWENSEFRALMPLAGYSDRYLYVTRDVNGDILNLLDETKATVILYQQLEADRGRLVFEFALIYLGFAVVVILAAMWLGLWFAERLSRPVGRLASAVQRVAGGDLNVRVREEEGDDEIAMLGRVFNRMTRQLRSQRDALISVNETTEQQRRLFDSVLSSVTAGVIGLDQGGNIEFINAAAIRMLDVEDSEGRALSELTPEFGTLFERLLARGQDVVQGEVKITRLGVTETLLVRMAARHPQGGKVEGFVVTFDDVSDLVSAQRMAAWGDVARRIAHEIKNPLTPIQLSAERIKRKFGPQVEDSETLSQLSDVIVRQTNDLRRIVDEFSKFARMPAPEPKPLDLIKLINGVVLLAQTGRPDLTFTSKLPAEPVEIVADGTMLNQAMTNLLKNAGEAIDSRVKKHGKCNGIVNTILEVEDGELTLKIQDNGIGLPNDRARLFEPYVTHRDNGTGLGLPIVKKIIEEHGGTLELLTAPVFAGFDHAGAEARIRLPPMAITREIHE
ncbi:MAG: PAS domain-containing sensor histidine kinase [Rhodobacteraceae bacterium]|nr:PAS domain-containing sensor histidine kinase [Paracoccaceae bacterium]